MENAKHKCHSKLSKRWQKPECELKNWLPWMSSDTKSQTEDESRSLSRPSDSDLTLSCHLTFVLGTTTASDFTWPSGSLSYFFTTCHFSLWAMAIKRSQCFTFASLQKRVSAHYVTSALNIGDSKRVTKRENKPSVSVHDWLKGGKEQQQRRKTQEIFLWLIRRWKNATRPVGRTLQSTTMERKTTLRAQKKDR